MKEFLESIKEFAELFRRVDGVVKIVSHFDADGICSAAILSKTLSRMGIKFSLSVVKKLDRGLLDSLDREPYRHIIFADLGSGSLDNIREILKDKNVFILDHHKISGTTKGLNVLSPALFEDMKYEDISGAGVVYLFARYLDPKNVDLAYLAVIGAIGDCQEDKGFVGLNKLILQDAVDNGDIEVKKGLVMFGIQSRPLDKVLLYSTDPYIPGVTGNREGVLSFLDEVGIKRKGNKYSRIVDLKETEMKNLVTAIILRRLGSEKEPEDVLGPTYIMKHEADGPTKDAKEFSTLLNSCGRLNRASLGIAVCLKKGTATEEANALLMDYRRELVNALNWFYSNKENLVEGDNYVIINAENNVNDSLIGTLASIIANSNIYKDFVILTMAYGLDGEIKISARTGKFQDVNLREALIGIIRKLGKYDVGGHRLACGATIPQEKEKEFIEVASNVLSKL